MFLLYRKLTDIFVRLWDWLRLLPIRIMRIALHLWNAILFFSPWATHWQQPFSGIDKGYTLVNWSTEFFFYLMDLFGVAEIYETIIDFVKFNTRPLTIEEIRLAQTIFGESLHYRRIRLDEAAYAGPKQQHFAYVSFFTVNSWGNLRESIFLHELTHVWQYQQLGAVYIPRALRAQFSKAGYNYGGLPQLHDFYKNKKKLEDFNLEQQADIIADYHRLKTGYKPLSLIHI